MNRVAAVSDRDVDNLPENVQQVTSLAVSQTTNRPVLVLTVGCVRFGQADGSRIEFALSPPAAAQLGRMLRKAVKTYLRSGDGSEGTQSP